MLPNIKFTKNCLTKHETATFAIPLVCLVLLLVRLWCVGKQAFYIFLFGLVCQQKCKCACFCVGLCLFAFVIQSVCLLVRQSLVVVRKSYCLSFRHSPLPTYL